MKRWRLLTSPVIILLVAAWFISPARAQDAGAAELIEEDEPPVIDREVFNSQLRLNPVEIEAAPFQTIDNVLSSHVGVNQIHPSSDMIQFRGTGVDGTNFIVDGISQDDPYSNTPSYSINLDAIESIQIQTSGFTAEYGNVRSGVINITTKGDTGAPTLMKISDEELAPVAGAFVAVVTLQEAHDRGAITVEQLESRVIQAITDQDLSLERYSDVVQAAQNNSRLQQRLLELAQEIGDQTN